MSNKGSAKDFIERDRSPPESAVQPQEPSSDLTTAYPDAKSQTENSRLSVALTGCIQKNTEVPKGRRKTQKQLDELKSFYTKNPNPSKLEEETISNITGLTEPQVHYWFSKRRSQDKNINPNQLEYSNINPANSSVTSFSQSFPGIGELKHEDGQDRLEPPRLSPGHQFLPRPEYTVQKKPVYDAPSFKVASNIIFDPTAPSFSYRFSGIGELKYEDDQDRLKPPRLSPGHLFQSESTVKKKPVFDAPSFKVASSNIRGALAWRENTQAESPKSNKTTQTEKQLWYGQYMNEPQLETKKSVASIDLSPDNDNAWYYDQTIKDVQVQNSLGFDDFSSIDLPSGIPIENFEEIQVSKISLSDDQYRPSSFLQCVLDRSSSSTQFQNFQTSTSSQNALGIDDLKGDKFYLSSESNPSLEASATPPHLDYNLASIERIDPQDEPIDYSIRPTEPQKPRNYYINPQNPQKESTDLDPSMPQEEPIDYSIKKLS